MKVRKRPEPSDGKIFPHLPAGAHARKDALAGTVTARRAGRSAGAAAIEWNDTDKTGGQARDSREGVQSAGDAPSPALRSIRLTARAICRPRRDSRASSRSTAVMLRSTVE